MKHWFGMKKLHRLWYLLGSSSYNRSPQLGWFAQWLSTYNQLLQLVFFCCFRFLPTIGPLTNADTSTIGLLATSIKNCFDWKSKMIAGKSWTSSVTLHCLHRSHEEVSFRRNFIVISEYNYFHILVHNFQGKTVTKILEKIFRI